MTWLLRCDADVCIVCGRYDDDCICPQCPVCDNVGDPMCYSYHGMHLSTDQLMSYLDAWARELKASREEQEYMERLYNEERRECFERLKRID